VAVTAQSADPGTATAAPLLRKVRIRAAVAMLGPAFVASVAYVDPGNFATNIQSGARYGYLLLWVVLAANLMAMLVQYLSAKLGIVTGQSLPEQVRERFPRPVSWGMWLQAEAMAMATDIAEFVGAALGLNLLFGIALLPAGLITCVITFAVLGLQARGYRRFELAIAGLLGLVVAGFLYETLRIGPPHHALRLRLRRSDHRPQRPDPFPALGRRLSPSARPARPARPAGSGGPWGWGTGTRDCFARMAVCDSPSKPPRRTPPGATCSRCGRKPTTLSCSSRAGPSTTSIRSCPTRRAPAWRAG